MAQSKLSMRTVRETPRIKFEVRVVDRENAATIVYRIRTFKMSASRAWDQDWVAVAADLRRSRAAREAVSAYPINLVHRLSREEVEMTKKKTLRQRAEQHVADIRRVTGK